MRLILHDCRLFCVATEAAADADVAPRSPAATPDE
jgi:hypothetical protein